MVLNFFWFQFSDSESEDDESESVQESNDSDDYSEEVMLIKVIFVIMFFDTLSKQFQVPSSHLLLAPVYASRLTERDCAPSWVGRRAKISQQGYGELNVTGIVTQAAC